MIIRRGILVVETRDGSREMTEPDRRTRQEHPRTRIKLPGEGYQDGTRLVGPPNEVREVDMMQHVW